MEDIYKKTFKLYKNWKPESNLPLINLSKFDDNRQEEIFEEIDHPSSKKEIPKCDISNHFKSFDQWKFLKIKNPQIDGLIIIPEILKPEFRQEWFEYFRDELPRQQNELNLKANISFEENKNLPYENYLEKLRWITFGYHHDWNEKIYNLNQEKIQIPDRIENLSKVIATFLNQEEHFKPEAGIINYYQSNSSLCFHTDHSELNHQAPLLSLSLGSSAIFLIGGHTKNDLQTPIIPILLNDSDLLIMSGKSRLALHSVPKILLKNEFFEGHQMKNSKKFLKSNEKNKLCRINVNIRQVF